MTQAEIDEVFNLKNGIKTKTGLWVDLYNFNPEKINIVDIAWALSMNCRFNGHTQVFYSVAEHSIWVADQVVEKEVKFAALMHDASEAYLSDIPSPFKQYLPDYKKIENMAMIGISERFGFQYPFPLVVKEADYAALAYEWENYVVGNKLPALTQHEAYEKFLKYFYELTT